MIKFYPAFLRAFPVVLFLLVLVSCNKFDKEERVPSYISIPAIEFIVPDSLKADQGTASAKITDAWIYLDDKLKGIFELPAKFPLLNEGEHSLKVFPGIKQNGIGI